MSHETSERRTSVRASCPRANSFYYGIAAATNGLVVATEPQLAAMIRLCAAVFRHRRWSSELLDDVRRRLAGHDEQAIWTAAYTPSKELWGHVGRKVDPTGQRPDGRLVIGLADMRRRIQEALH